MIRTKIIATLGPSSSTESIIMKMMLKGMDVVRLNFSHGALEGHLSCINIVRKVNRKYNRHVRILQDLEGPRIRIASLKDRKDIILKKREVIWLTQGCFHDENARSIPFDYEGDLSGMRRADFIYIDDGNIILHIKRVEKTRVKTEVVVGGALKEHKGINIPGAHLEFSAISEKDKIDLQFGIEQKVDYIAQSFVRNSNDIIDVNNSVKENHPYSIVIAKIENRDGIRNIDSIIDSADGIMIARGDMGVSVPLYQIPVIQKRIIRKCNRAGKPVITATQMLEHMVDNIRHTRADVTEVANAIIDGKVFVMLAAETALGKYPVEA